MYNKQKKTESYWKQIVNIYIFKKMNLLTENILIKILISL